MDPSISDFIFDYFRTGIDIVINAGRKQCKTYLQILKMHFTDMLTKMRQSLITPKIITQSDSNANLTELLMTLILTVVEKVKGVLQDLAVRKSSFMLKVYIKTMIFLCRFLFNPI